MDKSRNSKSLFFNGIKYLLKWARRWAFIIIAAFIIGFTNAFYNENRMINDTKFFDKQEQVIDDDNTNE